LWIPGFEKLALLARPSVTNASSARGTYSPVVRQDTHQCAVRVWDSTTRTSPSLSPVQNPRYFIAAT
jgi:hypothetical protein